ncbi:helix-turn-helix transcriptional regulator [Bacillaceae bacterium Marseille-Q3522]|nr:helix-turn-helix transcriptional regulator [Bacillaceae bacterium Marseille-Q3522]
MNFTLMQARIMAGLTQKQMAEKLGMSEKTYIEYEKYRKIFRMDVAFKFAKIVGINLENIIFFDEKLRFKCS